MTDDITPPSRRGAVVGWRMAWVIVRTFYSVRIHGADRVPDDGPVVLAPHHTGFVDAPLLMSTSPRPIHALAKKELFKGPLGWFLRSIGQIPLDRNEPGRALVRAGLEVLKADGVLVVFPEGTRGAGDFSEVQTGLAWFVLRGNAPVVPVVFRGTGSRGRTLSALPRLRSRLEVVFGNPVTINVENLRGRAALEAATSQLQNALVAHRNAVEAGQEVPPSNQGE